jgi:hypothetical protein
LAISVADHQPEDDTQEDPRRARMREIDRQRDADGREGEERKHQVGAPGDDGQLEPIGGREQPAIAQ